MATRGRPLKLDAAKSAKVIALLRDGNYLETAAAAIGVESQTVRNWMRDGERLRCQSDLTNEQRSLVAFADECGEAMSSAEAKDIARIDSAANVDWRAAAWRLERRHPSRWGPRVGPIVDEELAAFMMQLEQNLDALTFQRVLRAANGIADRQDRGEASSDLAERAAKIYGIGAALAAGTSTGEK